MCICLVFLLLGQITPVNIFAKSKEHVGPTGSDEQNPLRKAARGLVNLSLGFAEVPKQMISVNRKVGDTAGDANVALQLYLDFIGVKDYSLQSDKTLLYAMQKLPLDKTGLYGTAYQFVTDLIQKRKMGLY